MKIGAYDLINEEKVTRVIEGSLGQEGRLHGGIGADADEALILANYDKLGGLIKKGKYKVKTGSFYDFATRTPRKKPEVVFIFRDLNGEEVEVADGKEIPLEVRAVEVQEENRKAAKAPKGKKSKKEAEEDADESDEDEQE